MHRLTLLALAALALAPVTAPAHANAPTLTLDLHGHSACHDSTACGPGLVELTGTFRYGACSSRLLLFTDPGATSPSAARGGCVYFGGSPIPWIELELEGAELLVAEVATPCAAVGLSLVEIAGEVAGRGVRFGGPASFTPAC